jgi:hypothetical protein
MHTVAFSGLRRPKGSRGFDGFDGERMALMGMHGFDGRYMGLMGNA